MSFEGAFHGRTLGSLAVTHRKKARLGFPTFDWPHIPFPFEEAGAPKDTARREERSLKQLWDLLVSGRLPRADKSNDTYRREMDALDEFLAAAGPGSRRRSSRRSARTSAPMSSGDRGVSPPCSSSRFRAKAACAWRARASCASCGC